MSQNFVISQFRTNEKILRKLGASELIYDYELTNKCHILVASMRFTSKFDFFMDTKLVESSLHAWKLLNPFLRAKIVAQGHRATQQDVFFASDRYFLLSTEKTPGLDNVGFYRAEYDRDAITDKQLAFFARLLYEREFNNDPFDQTDELLWRLIFVELKRDHKTKEFSYLLTFNVHHGITDANNVFAILCQLLKIMEDMLFDKVSLNSITPVNSVLPAIESMLVKEDARLLGKILPPLNQVCLVF